MIFEYTIKASPDPENPNEQAAGTELNDDRIYGERVMILATNSQCYTSESFTKTILSNKLSSTLLTFSINDVIVLTTKEN